MANTCFTCQLPGLGEGEEGLVDCTGCRHSYHFGKCAGVTKKSFSGKTEASKKTWKCPTCRSNVSRASFSDDKQPELDVKTLLTSINQKLDTLPSLTEKVDNLERSVQYMSKRFDEFEKEMKLQKTEIKDLSTRVRQMEEKDELNRVVQERLQQEVNDLEFRSRRLNLEIHGIPAVQGENLLTSLNWLADKLEVPHLTESDITSAHRLPAKQGHVPGIIVRFTRQQNRDEWLKGKNKLKGSTPRIFIQENLTRYNRDLLRATKDQAKEKNYAFTWYTNGKVLVRRIEGARAIHIKSRDDLNQL
ncbi:unnamed protein product [Ixodes pacificus]